MSNGKKSDLGPSLKIPPRNIERNCLQCDKKFKTNNKFKRLCDQCKKDPKYKYLKVY